MDNKPSETMTEIKYQRDIAKDGQGEKGCFGHKGLQYRDFDGAYLEDLEMLWKDGCGRRKNQYYNIYLCFDLSSMLYLYIYIFITYS